MGFRSNSKLAVDPNSFATQSRVESLIVSSVKKSNQVLPPIKIGIENEFFISRIDGVQVGMNDSKRFFLNISELAGWEIYPDVSSPGEISKVSFRVNGIGYHCLKYEHPPHMLEIAFAPYSNLHDLYEAILSVWNDLESAASKSGLVLNFQSSIDAPQMDWQEVSKFSTKYRALAQTRESLVDAQFKNESWVHFTTYTAATQFHIGGGKWWDSNGSLVEKLYRCELLAGSNSYELLGTKNEEAKTLFKSRWAGYFQVFKDMKLVGFPELSSWTLDEWISYFCRSSLVVAQENPFFGKNLESIAPVLSDQELMSAIHFVRDLQIIKPKLIGTIEFRADPALPTPEKIMRQAALRFGVYHFCISGKVALPGLSFNEIGDRWRSGIDTNGIENQIENLREEVYAALIARQLGEEVFL